MRSGVGLRPPHYRELLDTRPELDLLELTSENFMVAGGNPRRVLARAAAAYPLALHGVSMELGALDPLDEEHLARLRGLADETQAVFVSDHLAWSRFEGRRGHDLWPLPYSEEALQHVASRVSHVQDRLGRRLLVENPSSYLAYAHSAMGEAEFLAELVARTGCGLLVDVNNVFVSGRNLGFSADDYLDALPADAVGYLHLAGFTDHGAYLLDTHDHPVADEVWRLYRRLILRIGVRPTVIEWDDRIPSLEQLLAEAARADIEAEACRARGA